MTSEINEKEFDKGVIEYEGLPVCLVRKIQITKASLSQDGIQRIFMTKEYQNGNVEEHKEIDDKLMQIYERKIWFEELENFVNKLCFCIYFLYFCHFSKVVVKKDIYGFI